MTSVPPPPDGWELKVVVPESQQQAVDTLIGYFTKTLAELPAGTVFDRTRYLGGYNVPCDDRVSGKPDYMFAPRFDASFPDGTDFAAIIATTGEIWKRWGWNVIERDGFDKPNRFGYAPDGYYLQIVTAYPPGYPPTLAGGSPCFRGELMRDDVAVPVKLPE